MDQGRGGRSCSAAADFSCLEHKPFLHMHIFGSLIAVRNDSVSAKPQRLFCRRCVCFQVCRTVTVCSRRLLTSPVITV